MLVASITCRYFFFTRIKNILVSMKDLEHFIKSRSSHVLAYKNKILSSNTFCYTIDLFIYFGPEAMFSDPLEGHFTFCISDELSEQFDSQIILFPTSSAWVYSLERPS